MSRFLSKIIIYLITALSINIAFIFILSYFDHDMIKRIESLKFTNKKYNALVFGNSLALDGIDTKYLNENGISSYNFAISGANIATNLVQLKEYLKNNEKPDLVVLCLSTCLGSYYEGPEIEEIHPIVKYTRSFEVKDLNFPLSIFRWKILELGKILFSKNHRNAKVVEGQYKSEKKIIDISSFKRNSFNIELLEKSQSLRSFSNYCQKKEIKIIFIDMPGFKSTRYDNISNDEEHKLFGNHLYPCNTIKIGNVFDSQNDWIANSHLNKYGAYKFSKITLFKIVSMNCSKEPKITTKSIQTHQGSN
jgi:hypothetical protein